MATDPSTTDHSAPAGLRAWLAGCDVKKKSLIIVSVSLRFYQSECDSLTGNSSDRGIDKNQIVGAGGRVAERDGWESRCSGPRIVAWL